MVPEHVLVGVAKDWQSIALSDPSSDGETCASLTETPVSVVCPVFVTTKVYGTTWPTLWMSLVVELFTTVNPATSTTAVDGADVIGVPDGGVPDAVAESLMVPLVMSAVDTV